MSRSRAVLGGGPGVRSAAGSAAWLGLGLLASLASALADLVLPAHCVGCGEPVGLLCGGCTSVLGCLPEPVWPSGAPAGFPPSFAAGDYEGVLRALILAHKERGCLTLARPLGVALAASVAASAAGSVAALAAGSVTGPAGGPGGAGLVLVPVPSRRAATRSRGHDPTSRLAVAAAAELRRRGVPARRLPALVYRRPVRDQAGLTAAARRANQSGAMAVRGRYLAGIRGATVVLVDDVVTTGATLSEAARVLAAAGAPAVAAATVAATRRRQPARSSPGGPGGIPGGVVVHPEERRP